MKGFNRREFGFGSASLLFSCACGRAAAPETAPTCDPSFDVTNGVMGLKIDYNTIQRLGTEEGFDFENSLIIVLNDMADYLGVNTGFGYYKETTIPNAAFIDDAPIKPLKPDHQSDGTILLGRQLLEKTKETVANFGAAITALCAHESGHALQKKYNQKKNFTLPDDPFRQVRYELCADFICGYYAQRRQSLDPKYPASIQAKTQFQLGDPALKSGGHGTAEQRGDAVRRGYLFGLKQPGDGEAAILEGVRYSLSLSL